MPPAALALGSSAVRADETVVGLPVSHFPTPSVAPRILKGRALSFSTGQVVVHPHHGPATIKKIATRTLRQERKRYLKLEVHHTELSVAVPEDRAVEIGVRPVVDRAEVIELVDVLLGPSSE